MRLFAWSGTTWVALGIASAAAAFVLSIAVAGADLGLGDDENMKGPVDASSPTPTATPGSHLDDEAPEDVLVAISAEYNSRELVDAILGKDRQALLDLIKTEATPCTKGDQRTGYLCLHAPVADGEEATVDAVRLSMSAHVVAPAEEVGDLLDLLFTGGRAEVVLVAREGDHVQLGVVYEPQKAGELSGRVFLDANLLEEHPINVISFEPEDSDLDALAQWRDLEELGLSAPLVSVSPALLDAEAARSSDQESPNWDNAPTPIVEGTPFE